MRSGFGAVAIRVDRRLYAVHDIVVDAVLDVRRLVFGIEQPLIVGFVLAEKQIRRPFAVQPARAVVVMVELDRGDFRRTRRDEASVFARPDPTTKCCETRSVGNR